MSVNDILANFKFEDLEINTKEIKNLIDENKPKLTTRGIKELIKDHSNKVHMAIQNAVFVESEDNLGFVVVNTKFDNEIKISSLEAEEVKVILVNIKKSMIAFSFLYGSYNTKRSWIRIDHKRQDNHVYVKFPILLNPGNHSSMVIALHKEVSELCMEKDNAILNILKRGQVNIPTEKRKFCFSKGHFLDEANREVIQKDINLIFKQMAVRPIADRKFDDLVFLTKVGSTPSFEKQEKKENKQNKEKEKEKIEPEKTKNK